MSADVKALLDGVSVFYGEVVGLSKVDLELRPGITGLAQIYDVDMSTPKKLARYDSVMIKNLNLRLYLRLLVATVLGRGSGDRIRSK